MGGKLASLCRSGAGLILCPSPPHPAFFGTAYQTIWSKCDSTCSEAEGQTLGCAAEGLLNLQDTWSVL